MVKELNLSALKEDISLSSSFSSIFFTLTLFDLSLLAERFLGFSSVICRAFAVLPIVGMTLPLLSIMFLAAGGFSVAEALLLLPNDYWWLFGAVKLLFVERMLSLRCAPFFFFFPFAFFFLSASSFLLRSSVRW